MIVVDDEGIAVVWSTAYLQEAELCETTLVLHDGQLIFSSQLIAHGTPDGLKDRCATTTNPDPSMEDAFIALITGREEA